MNIVQAKILLTCFLISIFTFSYGQLKNEKKLVEIKSFGNNPGNLRMFLYENNSEKQHKKPLVIVLHGCTQTAYDVATLTGWNKLAAQHHFYIIYPQQKFVNNPNLCFNWFLNNDIEKGKGENESIKQMIDYMIMNYEIDTTQIFITGLSAGAFMSVALIATHPYIFNSAAILAGGAYKAIDKPYQAHKIISGKISKSNEKLSSAVIEQNKNYKGRYPNIHIFQGNNDVIVNSKNSEIIVNQWASILGCDSKPVKITTSYLGFSYLTRYDYCANTNNNKLIVYKADNLGHKLLIKPGEKENEGGKKGLFGKDKGFHSTYEIAKEFGLILNK